ncbi:hypothetical protein ACFQ3Z_01445 [Streptomyces nogalater]
MGHPERADRRLRRRLPRLPRQAAGPLRKQDVPGGQRHPGGRHRLRRHRPGHRRGPQRAGDDRVGYWYYDDPGLDRLGCDWHPR